MPSSQAPASAAASGGTVSVGGSHPLETRLRALLRKAEPRAAAAAAVPGARAALLAALLARVRTKRAYADLFETPEATETWSLAAGLPAPQHELLLAMQVRAAAERARARAIRRLCSRPHLPASAAACTPRAQTSKDIFVPNWWLDTACTTAFAVEVVFIAAQLGGAGLLSTFLIFLLLADCVVSRVKLLSAGLGARLSAALRDAGLVDVSPLAGPIQMKKWTEQSWQLALHAVFAFLEWRIISSEPWYDDPATCWVPHPYEQAGHHRADLTTLYLVQLAVWVYTCVIHRFFDERRKDYFVLYIHHIVTIMLVGAWGALRRRASAPAGRRRGCRPPARSSPHFIPPPHNAPPPPRPPLPALAQPAPSPRATCASG